MDDKVFLMAYFFYAFYLNRIKKQIHQNRCTEERKDNSSLDYDNPLSLPLSISLVIFDVMGPGIEQKDSKALNKIIFSVQLIELAFWI